MSFLSACLASFLGSKKKTEAQKKKLLLTIIEEARAFITLIKEQKGLTPIVATSILLKEGEDAYLQTEGILYEATTVKKYIFTKEEDKNDIISVMMGSDRGPRSLTPKSHEKWTNIDEGSIGLTNKRLIFNGIKENRVILLEKIVSATGRDNVVEISVEDCKKKMLFRVENPFILSIAIDILIETDNPQKIDENILRLLAKSETDLDLFISKNRN